MHEYKRGQIIQGKGPHKGRLGTIVDYYTKGSEFYIQVQWYDSVRKSSVLASRIEPIETETQLFLVDKNNDKQQ